MNKQLFGQTSAASHSKIAGQHLVAHRGVGGVPEEADHLGVRGWAGEGHVAVSEGAVDLEVEAGLAGGVAELSQGLHSVGRQVKVEVVGPDLRSRHLKLKDEEKSGHKSINQESPTR